MATTTIIVQPGEQLNYNGTLYSEGAEVEMDGEHVKALPERLYKVKKAPAEKKPGKGKGKADDE